VEDGVTHPPFGRIRDSWGEILKSKNWSLTVSAFRFYFYRLYASKLSTPLKNKTGLLQKPVFGFEGG